MESLLPEIIKAAEQVGIFAFASYFIQKSIDTSAAKRLEEFKSTLGLIQIKETALHGKRFLVIEELNGKLVDFDYAMKALIYPIKFDSTQEAESKLFELANTAFQSFNMFFEKNKIYFSVDICKKLEDIRKKFFDALWDYNQPRIVKGMEINDGGKMFREVQLKAIEVYRQVNEDFPKLREGLESELRKILNVAENNTANHSKNKATSLIL